MKSHKKVVQIEGKVEWKCFRAKGGNWVAICEPLKLTIQSEIWTTLMEDIGQTLNAILRDLMQSQGEFEQFFRDKGWRSIGPIPSSKPADIWFDIPCQIRLAPSPAPPGAQ